MEHENIPHVQGGISSSGTKYFEIGGPGIDMCLQAAELSSKSKFDHALEAHQLILTPHQRAQIILQASKVLDFPNKEYAERGGWSGTDHYIQSNGNCISAEGKSQRARIVFAAEQGGISEMGTLAGWHRLIARPLTGQILPQFLVMSGFAGPVLALTKRPLNVLFEVVGDGGEGKSSAIFIAASASGRAVESGVGTYWFTPNGTTNWLEQRMVSHADSTAFINEFQVFGAGLAPTARAQMIYDFVFRFSEGQTRGRFAGIDPLTYRGVAVLTANQGVRELMGARHAQILNPTTSRLVSLPGDAGFGFGTLDFVPEGKVSARSFITSILAATERQHGTAMPVFLQGLVDLRAANDRRLRSQIASHIDDFISRAAGDAGGMNARVAEAFAIVYVSGRLARHLGVLPSQWDPLAVALECYRRYRASIQLAEGKPVPDSLRAYAARADVIDLDQGLPSLTDEQLQSCSGFRRVRNEIAELYVPAGSIMRLFPNWNLREHPAEVAAFLQRDGSHLTQKKVVRAGGKKDRVHVFAGF